MVSRSNYNLKIDTVYMYDILFDRSFLQISNGIRHVMPSTDTKTDKTSMAQPVSQPAVYANGLKWKMLVVCNFQTLFEILNYSAWYAIHVNFIFSVFFGLMFNLRGPHGQKPRTTCGPRTTVWETLVQYIRNTWEVLTCGTGEGWGGSVGPIMWEMKKCYLQSRSRGISYVK
jgi:hypothetical protein